MASLEVRWSGAANSDLGDALRALGVQETEAGVYSANGEGRTLVRVLGKVEELTKALAGDASPGRVTIRFIDDSTAL